MNGFIYTTCPECLNKARVLVDFPEPNAGFTPTEWTCRDCRAELIVTDPNEYGQDGKIVSTA